MKNVIVIVLMAACVVLAGSQYATEPAAPFRLTLNFTGMTPHLGQKLQARLVDKATLRETARAAIASVTATFSLNLDGLSSGGSYWVDFFSDHNNNGVYDKPPTDHAWRMEINNVVGDASLNFSHNTTFTDIKWEYLLTVNFSNMTPHVGQTLQLRVVDQDSKVEVGRSIVQTISGAVFSVSVPGLRLSKNYNIDFYSDHNKNGGYNAPPVDHAWRLQTSNVLGDITLSFIHNTTFTDIAWPPPVPIAQLAGLWKGSWNNETFATTGPIEATILVIPDSQKIRCTLKTKNAFGNPDEATFTFEGQLLNDNMTASFAAPIPLSGRAVLIDGQVVGAISNVTLGLNIEVNGVYTSTTMAAAYVISGLINAKGTMQMQKEDGTAVVDKMISQPLEFQLSQNYPNPFNPVTRIRFNLPVDETVRLQIFNTTGQLIRNLAEQKMVAGSHEMLWDGTDDQRRTSGSGTYLYRIQAGGFVKTNKMVLVK